MCVRFWLDYIAAAKFLLEGHFANAKAVYEARKAYHQLKPEYTPKRKENLEKRTLSTIPELMRDSLILAFYLKGKRTFKVIKDKPPDKKRNPGREPKPMNKTGQVSATSKWSFH